MKTIIFKHRFWLTTLLIVLSINQLKAIDTIRKITFEDGSENYNWDTWGNNGDTSAFVITDNPSKTGIDKSDKVGRYTCHAGSNSWAGMNIHDSLQITITDSNKYFAMDVYKGDINKVVMVLEQGNGSTTRFDSYPFNTKTDEWETIVFDFSSQVGNTFFRLTIQPDLTANDPRTDSSIVYLDNIRWYKNISDIVKPLQPITFENGTDLYTWDTWGNNGDTACFTVVDNPDKSGINSSDKVGKYICHAGSNSWAGMNIHDSVLIDITEENRYFAMDVYKPDINKVVMVLEKGDGTVTRFDSYPYNTMTDEWETLIFDFTSLTGNSFYRLTIQPDLTANDPRADSSVIYMDNIRWFKDLPKVIEPLKPLTFEDGTTEYRWDTWGNDGDTTAFSIVDNPVKSGINTSDKVGRYICHAGSNSWAGMNIHDSVLIEITDENKFFTMDVYKANITKVVIVLEQGDGAVSRFDSYPYNTKTDEWETLVFDFSSLVGNDFYRLTIQPELSAEDPRTDSSIVYLDNIKWYPINPNPPVSLAKDKISDITKFYPNPVKENLNIITYSDATVEIININGQVLNSFQTCQNEYIISTTELTKGIYFISVRTANTSEIYTLIKE